MSQEISDRSSQRPIARKSKRREEARARTTFLRLYGDIIDELNNAVRYREADGCTRADIARKANLDPAVLSKVLSGQAGNNVRTIAAVLNGTDHRFKIKAVPSEKLRTYTWVCQSTETFSEVSVLEFHSVDGCWKVEPHPLRDGNAGWEVAEFTTVRSAAKAGFKSGHE